MVTKLTGRPRGRPGILLPQMDKDRGAVASVLATMKLEGISLRRAAEIVAAIESGNEVEHNPLPPLARVVVARCPPHMRCLAYGAAGYRDGGFIKNTRPGVGAATIKGRANTLRKKVDAACRNGCSGSAQSSTQ